MTGTKKTRERSPKYPIIDLREAIERIKELYKQNGRNLIAREPAVKTWGYKSLSGRSLQILSSLAQYGLINNEKGHIRLSNDAFTIINAPEGVEKIEAIKRTALAPMVFQSIKKQYPDSTPSDESLKWYLQKERFTEPAAEMTIQCFKETISFAGIGEKEYNAGGGNDDNAENEDKTPSVNNNPQNQPPKGGIVVKGRHNMITDTFTLEEGPVALQYPTTLRQSSYEDLESWIELQLRKIKRSIKIEEEKTDEIPK